MRGIDLHVHSTRSDGTYTPTELVDYAMEKGLAAFALTDHDTIDGLTEAISYADRLRSQATDDGSAAVPSNTRSQKISSIPEIIPGIEFSTEYMGQDIHIVGLDIHYDHPSFQHQLQEFMDSRTNRNLKMCSLLRQAGIQITYEDLLQMFPNAVITRAHYAKFMLTKGYIKSMAEAFDRYVGDRCPCYVPREKVTPGQAVSLILETGGIPILAHPILYHMSKYRLDHLVLELKEAGLIGIEAIYSTYKAHEEREIRQLAAKYGLKISGGSDFHGDNKPGLDLGTGYGQLFVPESVLTELREHSSSIPQR